MCRNFRSLGQWANEDFHQAVNPTCEALILQISKFQMPVWEKDAEAAKERQDNGEEDSIELPTKQKAGAKQGVTETAARTFQAYEEFGEKVLMARSSSKADMWKAKLKLVARKKMLEDMALKPKGAENQSNSQKQENESDQSQTEPKKPSLSAAMFALAARDNDNEDEGTCAGQTAYTNEVARKAATGEFVET